MGLNGEKKHRSSRGQGGLTLLEVLVVLALTSTISVLLMQSIGFFLNNFHRVLKHQEDYAENVISLSWFRGSMASLVASKDAFFQFKGLNRNITGFTLSPVLGLEGSLTKITWRVIAKEGRVFLQAREAGHREVTVASWQGSDAYFLYRGIKGGWQSTWPVEGVPEGALPWRVKLVLVNGSEIKEVYSAVLLSRLPKYDYREFL